MSHRRGLPRVGQRQDHLDGVTQKVQALTAHRLLPWLTVTTARYALVKGFPERAFTLLGAYDTMVRKLGFGDHDEREEFEVARSAVVVDDESAALAIATGQDVTVESVFDYLRGTLE